MAKLIWDQTSERKYYTGVDQVALYLQDTDGSYKDGVAFNGVTGITQSPEGGEANDFYADNMKYLTIMGKETFGGTVKAYMYPDEWAEADGSAEPAPGMRLKAQTRKPFGLVWRSIIGNDTLGNDYGYMLHIVYNARIQPSSVDNNTVNDSPEPSEFSWDFKTTEINIEGYKPTAYLEIDSTKCKAGKFDALCEALYGTGTDESTNKPTLLTPAQIADILNGTEPTPTEYTITLNKSAVELTAGGTEQLTATVTPSGTTVTWTIADVEGTDVATISNAGLITAGANAGTATVTASITDGTTPVTATCAVTVTAG